MIDRYDDTYMRYIDVILRCDPSMCYIDMVHRYIDAIQGCIDVIDRCDTSMRYIDAIHRSRRAAVATT